MEKSVLAPDSSRSNQLVSPLNFHWSGNGRRPDRQVDIDPLLAYLKSLSSTSLVLYRPRMLPYNSSDSIYGLLDLLVSGSFVPAVMLEEILSLALIPRNLYGFQDSRVISTIIKLLRSHYQETSTLFDGAYGFPCISILIVALEVHVLILADELDDFMEDETDDPDTSTDTHTTLAATVSDMLYRNMMCWGKNPGKRPETLRVTGLSAIDAGFLLMALTEERDIFPAARIAYPGRWPGWSVLFYMITVNTGDFMEYIPPDREAIRMIQELVGRFGLAESKDESDLVQLLSFCVDNPKDREGVGLYGTASPQEDTELLALAYMARVSYGPTCPNIDFSHYLLRWILVRVGIDEWDLLRGIMQASLSRLWIALEEDECVVTTTEYANHILINFEALFMVDEVKAKDHIALSHILLDTELFDLFGRVLVLPTTHGRTADELFGEESIARKRTAFFIDRAISPMFKRFPAAKTILAKSYYDWANLMRYLHREWETKPLDNPLHDYYLTVQSLWFHIGDILGFVPRWRAENATCGNPRCIDPLTYGSPILLCSRCGNQVYCSLECRAIHWRLPLESQSHRAECSI